MHSIPAPKSVSAALAALLISLPLAGGGCELIGLVASRTLPEPKVPAVWELEPVPTAVVVEADANIYGERAIVDADTVGLEVERVLEKRTETPVVPEMKAERRVVITLDPIGSEAVAASDLRTGSAAAWVKVVDAEGRELFPGDGSEGRYVQAQTPRIEGGDAGDLRRATLRALGGQVARLFYPHVAGGGA